MKTAGVIVRFIPRRLAEEAVGRLAKLLTVISDDTSIGRLKR